MSGDSDGATVSDEPGSQPWTPEQKAAFNRWGEARMKAFKQYMGTASARWRRFCAKATDTDRETLRADVAWAISEQGHDDPEPTCSCGDLDGHAQQLAGQITFDPGRYFTLVSESMEDSGSESRSISG
jgi:hypothetical protein